LTFLVILIVLLGENKFMKTIPLAKAKARRGEGAAGGLASVSPPPEDFDSEIDAMVEEIFEARAKSARSMARAFRALTF
jgi:uncharacterized protein YdbL (DUF1318 family)